MRPEVQIDMRGLRTPARVARILAAFALIAVCGIAPVPHRLALGSRAILGQKPSYGPASISEVPNFAAIDRLIWVPGLDEGWDPQGLAIGEGNLFVSAYQSGGLWVNRGPCRVFRIDPETGTETGHFDVPPPCGHAGGLAYAGGGKLFIMDTHALFEVGLDRAFNEPAPKFRVWTLGPGVKGAFAVSGQGEIWIGDYETERTAEILKYPVATLELLPDGTTVTKAMAVTGREVQSYAQGVRRVPASFGSRAAISAGVFLTNSMRSPTTSSAAMPLQAAPKASHSRGAAGCGASPRPGRATCHGATRSSR